MSDKPLGGQPFFGQTVHLGTRASALARWQTDHVADLLRTTWPALQVAINVISTRGDRVLDTPLPLVGGKGLFTLELESALRSGEIDCAVHSLKDLPTEETAGLCVGAIPQRAAPGDALVCRQAYALETLPKGAVIGTSSRRRAAQLRHYRPDLQILDIRGNVDTRIRKVQDPDGPYDATVLAMAGLERLQCSEVVSQLLPPEIMLPAPGQGALAVQCRDEAASLALLSPIADPESGAAVAAERAFLNRLEGGCSVPVAAHAHLDGDVLALRGRVSALDGSTQIDVGGQAAVAEAAALGIRLAEEALAQGAAAILQAVKQSEDPNK